MDASLGIDPAIFGPGIWLTMHLIALNTSADDDRVVWMTHAVINVLMCSTCRHNAQKYLKKNPITYNGTPLWAFDWWLEFHNHVNLSKGKPTWSREKALSYYRNLLSEMSSAPSLDCQGCSIPRKHPVPNII